MPDALLASDQMLPKSLSDTEVIGSPPPKSPSTRDLAVEELSGSTAAVGDRFWLILAHVPEQSVEVLLAVGDDMIPAEDVVERDKLVTFVIPRLSNPAEEVQLCLRSFGSEVRIPVKYTENDRRLRRSPSQLNDSLQEFARTGELLPLLRPFVASIRNQDVDGNTSLHTAAKSNQSYALKALLSALPENEKLEVVNMRNVRGLTALHCAIRSGDPDSVHYLVNNGANISLTDIHKNTTVHYLADAYNEAIFKEVLEPKDDMALPLEDLNDEGHSALHLAVRRLKLSLVEMLLEAGSQVNAADADGKTSLMHAVIMNDPELVQFLVQRQADCNVEDKSGATALLLARQNANYVILGLLLDGGADPQQKNKQGECLADWDDDMAQRVIGGHRVTPPPKEVEWSTPKDLPATREALFGRSIRPVVDNGVSRVILKQPGRSSSSPSPPPRQSFSSRFLLDDQPSTSRSSASVRHTDKAFCKDDISCLDYLTRLRLSKVLDFDAKWQLLARELNCEHMIELIAICSDEDSSPSMILLDQFEQLPEAKISQVREALERMGQADAVELIDKRAVF